jgi:two-component system OmpR family sensor kinase
MLDDQARLLDVLERLLEIPAADLNNALLHASDRTAEALRADKVDAFLYVRERDSLIATASSSQPLSATQRKHGLDVLPISNGGRAVGVYQTGKTYASGRVDEDMDELRGIREILRVRSAIGIPLEVGGRRRGVLLIASQQRDKFTPADVRFAESVVRFIGVLAHRAELVEEIARNSVAQGRRAAAEELIVVFAHDMRNHLTPVMTRLQLLQRRAERDGSDFALKELGLALRSLDRLGALISDILDVARLDGGLLQVVVQPVDIVALMRDAASTFSSGEQRILIRVKAESELFAAADPARLRQVVDNLLSNALKHSPARAPVTVVVSREAREGREMVLAEVIDEGPGIPADVAPRLFERFVTGRSAEGGLGLGLYLAKRIAQVHGGDLRVQTPPGKGAHFVLSVPAYNNA